MKISGLIAILEKLPDNIKDKDVVVIAPNGLEFEPAIKYQLKDRGDALNFQAENIEKVVLDFDGR